jgi:hypothetical protein
MTISYTLLSIPPVLLLLLMIIVFALAGGLSTYLFRKFIRVKILRSHNEVTGNVFACAGGLYSLILAFVVFLVWDGFNDASSHADMEFSLAKGLYRDIQYYPDTVASKKLEAVYLDYVNKVVSEEYPAMSKLERVPLSSKRAFDRLFIAIEQMEPQNVIQVTRSDEMFRHLNELATNRSLRQLSANSGIPFQMWLPLLIGGFITLIFVVMLDIENKKLHIFLSSMLGAFIGLVMYLIVILDYPFSGYMSIQPTGYQDIIEWDKGM